MSHRQRGDLSSRVVEPGLVIVVLESTAWGAEVGKREVCTMCTPWASDRVVPGPVRAGLGMFSGEWRICKVRSPVRVPSRARVFPQAGGPLGASSLVDSVNTLSARSL